MKHYNIPIFVPHKGCPFDCVFCNQKRITGSILEVDENTIKNTIEEYLKTLPKADRYIEVAFFGGSFTGIDFSLQGQFLNAAYQYIQSGKIDGIRLSTRPDYIDKKILDQLKKYGVTTIELGVQSMVQSVLDLSNRGHSEDDVKKAVELIKKYNFKLGLQMMTGLPGDTQEYSIETANKIIALKPDFVRIYPTLVVKDTQLEYMYNNGEYNPMSLVDTVNLCKKLLMMFTNAKIDVIRISLQTTDEISPGGSLVAGPYDAQFRELVESEIYYDKFYDAIKRCGKSKITIIVNTFELSKAIGKKRSNIKNLEKEFNAKIRIKADNNVTAGEFYINTDDEEEEINCI